MCRDVNHGGRRCPHSTKLATIRRTARRRLLSTSTHASRYELAKVQKEAVEKYLKANPDVAKELLPVTNEFNNGERVRSSGRKLKAFANENFGPIAVVLPETEKMAEEFAEMEQAWTRDEFNAVIQYTINGFDKVNAYLRNKTYFRKLILEDSPPESYAAEKEYVINRIQNLKSAVLKGQGRVTEPRKVYRYVRLPDGVSPSEYVDKYITPGNIMQNPGFLSTSTDPGFVLTHMLAKSTQKYVVLEILTKQGVSVQEDFESSAGNVQSLEHEVLMAPDSKFAVVDVTKRGSITVEEPNPALVGYLARQRTGPGSAGLRVGKKYPYTVIRLADPDLLT